MNTIKKPIVWVVHKCECNVKIVIVNVCTTDQNCKSISNTKKQMQIWMMHEKPVFHSFCVMPVVHFIYAVSFIYRIINAFKINHNAVCCVFLDTLLLYVCVYVLYLILRSLNIFDLRNQTIHNVRGNTCFRSQIFLCHPTKIQQSTNRATKPNQPMKWSTLPLARFSVRTAQRQIVLPPIFCVVIQIRRLYIYIYGRIFRIFIEPRRYTVLMVCR